MKQIDIFGNEIDLDDIPVPVTKGRTKFKTMQEQYGTLDSFHCKNCKHCIRCDYHNKTYYKCDLWFISSSEATDIRLKNTACRKYEEKE